MKGTIKMLICAFVSSLMIFFANADVVYAAEAEEKLELTAEETQEILELLREMNVMECTLNTSESVAEHIFVAEDAPADIMNVLKQRSAASGYEVINYSKSKKFYTEVLGEKVDVFTVYVSGQVFLYEDGKIHLYTMQVRTVEHIPCGTEVVMDGIHNTDGTYAIGIADVLTSELPFGEHCVRCMVMVSGVDEENSPAIEVSIGQVW